jgi:hypothetical protein
MGIESGRRAPKLLHFALSKLTFCPCNKLINPLGFRINSAAVSEICTYFTVVKASKGFIVHIIVQVFGVNLKRLRTTSANVSVVDFVLGFKAVR